MQALTLTAVGDGLALADAADPRPGPGDVLVQVRAVSANRGEVHRLNGAGEGWRPGWDFAGEVIDRGSGVQEVELGERVFGAVPGGAWAERVAAPAGYVARLPEALSWAHGAALPVAGLTAMRVLRLAPRPLDGARVLITGAAGGVGRFAVQLAAAAGAGVAGVVGRAERAVGLAGLGARELIVGIEAVTGPFDLVLESAGGRSLSRALALVAPGGLVVAFGNSSREPTAFHVEDFYYAEAALRGYYLWRDLEHCPPAEDLARLAGLVADGRLRLDIGEVAPWERMPEVLDRLGRRRIAGKAVLLLEADR